MMELPWVLFVEIIATLLITAFTLHRYSNWQRNHVLVSVTVFICWYFSYLIVFLLPLDVTSTVYRQCLADQKKNSSITCIRPWHFVSDDFFNDAWKIVYWTSQFLTWIIMPVLQSYSIAGEFTVKKKLKSAIRDNIYFYASFLAIFGILVVYVAVKENAIGRLQLAALVSSASNTWGLFLLIMILGYALVNVPRNLWLSSSVDYKMDQLYFKISKTYVDKCDAENDIEDVFDRVQAAKHHIERSHLFYDYLEIIYTRIPCELNDKFANRRVPNNIYTSTPNENDLIKLHRQVITSVQALKQTQTQWITVIAQMDRLRALLDKMIVAGYENQRPINRFFGNFLQGWFWRLIIADYVQKFTAIIAGILSAAIVWSEMTFFVISPTLSLFALLTEAATKSHNYIMLEIAFTCVISYMCYCAYSSVLRIRLFNWIYLAPNHQSSEYSLVFSGLVLSRLTSPICLNFLGLIHMDTHVIATVELETFYTQVMGHMDLIKIISNGFNVYFPMIMLVFCMATYLRVGSRIATHLGFQQFIQDDDMTADMIAQGQNLYKLEVNKRRDPRKRQRNAVPQDQTSAVAATNELNDRNRLINSSFSNEVYCATAKPFDSFPETFNEPHESPDDDFNNFSLNL